MSVKRVKYRENGIIRSYIVYGLFNDAVRISDCVVSNCRMISE
jgi:hypothetical protein